MPGQPRAFQSNALDDCVPVGPDAKYESRAAKVNRKPQKIVVNSDTVRPIYSSPRAIEANNVLTPGRSNYGGAGSPPGSAQKTRYTKPGDAPAGERTLTMYKSLSLERMRNGGVSPQKTGQNPGSGSKEPGSGGKRASVSPRV